MPGWGRSPRGRNGNPFQYSCLGNPMDRGAWWATVHRVSQSQTWLRMHASHLICSGDQINTIPISLSKDVQKSFLEILGAPFHELTHTNFEFVDFSLVGRADGLLRSEAHLWPWVDTLCGHYASLGDFVVVVVVVFTVLTHAFSSAPWLRHIFCGQKEKK